MNHRSNMDYVLVAFLGRNLWQMTTSQWHRFGYACVNFGTPLSMRA